MEPAQAMFNESAISRTLVADALAGRCAQLAGEKAVLENQVAELQEQLATAKKEKKVKKEVKGE